MKSLSRRRMIFWTKLYSAEYVYMYERKCTDHVKTLELLCSECEKRLAQTYWKMLMRCVHNTDFCLSWIKGKVFAFVELNIALCESKHICTSFSKKNISALQSSVCTIDDLHCNGKPLSLRKHWLRVLSSSFKHIVVIGCIHSDFCVEWECVYIQYGGGNLNIGAVAFLSACSSLGLSLTAM